jgi:hypothetical protein
VLRSRLSLASLAIHGSLSETVECLSNCMEDIRYNFIDFLWIPHGVLKDFMVAFLAFLSIEFEEDNALVVVRPQLEPEDNSSLHRGPSLAARLAEESDFGAVAEDLKASVGVDFVSEWHKIPVVRIGLLEDGEEILKDTVPHDLHIGAVGQWIEDRLRPRSRMKRKDGRQRTG